MRTGAASGLLTLSVIVAIVLICSAAAYLEFAGGPSTSTQSQQASSSGGMTSTSGRTTSFSGGTTSDDNNATVSTRVSSTEGDTTNFVLGNSSTVSAVDGNEARKVFQALGLTWVFYTDGNNLVYQTVNVSDSLVSSPTVVGPEAIGWHFSVWYDRPSNTLYYVSTDAQDIMVPETNQTQGDCQGGYGVSAIQTSNSTSGSVATTMTTTPATVSAMECAVSGFTYGWGTPTAGGTIDWNVSQSFMQGTGTDATNPYIYGNGAQVWVSLQTNGGANVEVWKFDGGNSSSWSKVDEVSTPLGSMNEILPLKSGIALVYAVGGLYLAPRFSEMYVTTTTDDGATWSTPVSTGDNSSIQNALSVGNTVYVVGIDDTGDASQVIFWSYTMGASAFTPVQVIASGYSYPFISTDGNSSLVVSYIDNFSVYIRTSTDLGGSWGPQTLVATSPGGILPPAVTPFQFEGSVVPICWLPAGGSDAPSYQLQCTSVGVGRT